MKTGGDIVTLSLPFLEFGVAAVPFLTVISGIVLLLAGIKIAKTEGMSPLVIICYVLFGLSMLFGPAQCFSQFLIFFS